MKAPLGATVRIYLDTRQDLFPGDVVETPSGRLYLIIDVRVQQREEATTDVELDMLRSWAAYGPDERGRTDWRTVIARRQLAERGVVVEP